MSTPQKSVHFLTDPISATAFPGPVLYFAPRPCFPPGSGAELRNYYLARQLSLGTRVTYLSFTDDTAGTDSETVATPEEIQRGRVVTVPRERGYTPDKVLKGILGSTPLPILNYESAAMAQMLEKLLRENDFAAVQVEGIHLASYLPIIRAARSKPVVVADWHNVESEVMSRYGERTSPLRAFYAKTTARKMAAMEKRILGEFDAHLAVSERDRQQLLPFTPPDKEIHVIENGVNVAYFSEPPAGEAPKRHRVVFTGLMNYHANVDAALHFTEKVWPAIHAQRPDLTFTLVGRSPTPAVQRLAEIPGVEVTGQVEDVRPYFHEAMAAVVPLRIGGGSRLKILEAMAIGVPIVSTLLGAEGLDAHHGEHLLIADTENELRDAVLKLARDTQLGEKIVAAGYRLASEGYDWPAIGNKLRSIYARLLTRNH